MGRLTAAFVLHGAVALSFFYGACGADAKEPGRVCGESVGCCGCCDAVGVCGDSVLSCPLLSYIKPSDRCFDDWISPVTNPVFFEDPRTLTEARALFLQHKVPSTAGGGDIQLYALQLRAALTDRLSLIATKDGYAVSSNPLIRDGWGDVGAGFKYNFYRDVCTETLISAGATYEIPAGSRRTHQGNGDGEFHLFVTGGTEFGDCCHWLSAYGLRIAANDNSESSSLYWSNHFDRHLGHGWYALAEFNWFHWLESGAGGIPGVEGLDLFNFGSTGVAGNDIVTGAFGLTYKPNRNRETTIAWENPLTRRRDVIENRLNVSVIFRY